MASKRVTTAESALKTANSLFVDENYEEALIHYNESIELDSSNEEAFVKRSICNYKLEKFTDALADANSAVKLQPNNPKAYLRKGFACFSLEEFETALVAFQKGQELEPENSTFKTWIRKCKAELESETTAANPKEENTKKSKSVEPSTPIQQNIPPTTNQTVPPPTVKQTEPPATNNTVSHPPPASSAKLRHEWYQTESHIFVTIFVKNVKKEDATITIEPKSLYVSIKLSSSNEYQMDVNLCGEVIPTESISSFLSTKVEIKLKKNSPVRWKTLEDVGEPVKQWDSFSQQKPSTTPLSNQKNWDKIVEEETKGEKLDGEDSLNKVFQDIYGNATDEQKRAMMKSYVESGGTVLSTNWEEVGKDKVKGSPPEGMEMKEWNELHR